MLWRQTWKLKPRWSRRRRQLEQAQLNLGFTRITSPVDGIPGIARAQIGDLVGPRNG